MFELSEINDYLVVTYWTIGTQLESVYNYHQIICFIDSSTSFNLLVNHEMQIGNRKDTLTGEEEEANSLFEEGQLSFIILSL